MSEPTTDTQHLDCRATITRLETELARVIRENADLRAAMSPEAALARQADALELARLRKAIEAKNEDKARLRSRLAAVERELATLRAPPARGSSGHTMGHAPRESCKHCGGTGYAPLMPRADGTFGPVPCLVCNIDGAEVLRAQADPPKPDEDPGHCLTCGKAYELVRPGKSQPTCECDDAPKPEACPCGSTLPRERCHPIQPKPEATREAVGCSCVGDDAEECGGLGLRGRGEPCPCACHGDDLARRVAAWFDENLASWSTKRGQPVTPLFSDLVRDEVAAACRRAREAATAEAIAACLALVRHQRLKLETLYTGVANTIVAGEFSRVEARLSALAAKGAK